MVFPVELLIREGAVQPISSAMPEESRIQSVWNLERLECQLSANGRIKPHEAPYFPEVPGSSVCENVGTGHTGCR
ncbi:hypothetical protein D3C74_384460 [compost metagenome]